MSALRPCPSNPRTSSQDSVASDWEGVRVEDGEAGRQIWPGSGEREWIAREGGENGEETVKDQKECGSYKC